MRGVAGGRSALAAGGGGTGEKDRELAAGALDLYSLFERGKDALQTKLSLSDEKGGVSRHVAKLTVSVVAAQVLGLVVGARNAADTLTLPPSLKSMLELHTAALKGAPPPPPKPRSRRAELDRTALDAAVTAAVTAAEAKGSPPRRAR